MKMCAAWWLGWYIAACFLSGSVGSGFASRSGAAAHKVGRTSAVLGMRASRALMLRGGGKGDDARDKNEFPTLDEAAGALAGNTAGKLGPGVGSRLGSMGVGLHSNGEEEEENENEEERNPGQGREEGRGAVAAWGMKKGAGEGMWQGSDYVMLRHARVGTSVELVSQDEHFSFLFSCRAGGEVRAFLGASGVAFTSGFCAEVQTAKDRTRRVEGQHGVWKFQVHGDDDELITVTHKNGIGCGELILTTRGFVFVPEGATQAIVVEDAKLGKVGVESAREMLASGMEMLPFRKREPMKKVRVASGPSWGGEPGREAGVQDGGRGNDEGEEEEMEMREEEKMEEEGKEEEEEEEEEEEDEGGDVKIADLLATQREAVTGYDGVLEPADEVMALRRERRDEGVSDYEESNESEEEENRRLQNVLYQKPEDVDSEEGSDSKDEKFDEFMRPVGEEWKNFRHPTGKQWEGVGPDQEDAKTHTQFSYVGMSVADVVNSKFEEVDNKAEIFRRARVDLIQSNDAVDDDEAMAWLRKRGGDERDGSLFSDVKHALYMVEAGEVGSVAEAFNEMEREKDEWEGFSEGDIDQSMIGTGKFEHFKSLVAAREDYARSRGEIVPSGVDWRKGDEPPEGPVRSEGVFLGGLQIAPEQLDEWEEERRRRAERMGPATNALQKAAVEQREMDREHGVGPGLLPWLNESDRGMDAGNDGNSSTNATTTSGMRGVVGLAEKGPVAAVGFAGEGEGRRMCYFDEWDGRQDEPAKVMDAELLEGVVVASRRGARLGKLTGTIKKAAVGVIEGGMNKSEGVGLDEQIGSIESRLKELKALDRVKSGDDDEKRPRSDASGLWHREEDDGLTAEKLLQKYIGATASMEALRRGNQAGKAPQDSAAARVKRGEAHSAPANSFAGDALAGASHVERGKGVEGGMEAWGGGAQSEVQGREGSASGRKAHSISEAGAADKAKASPRGKAQPSVWGAWGQGNASAKLFRAAASIQEKEAVAVDMGVHEAVVRASELLKRAQEERAKNSHARAASNATTSIYKAAPDWLAPPTLDGIGGEYSDDNGARAENDLEEVEWDGDLTWAAGDGAGPGMAEDDGFVTASMANGPTGSGGGGGGADAGAGTGDLAGEATATSSFSLRDASEVWDIVQGRGMQGYGYTVLRLRTLGTVIELFHDSDDGHFRFMPGKAVPREKAQDGSPLWKGSFTRSIMACARWGDYWERAGFNAHSLVRRVTERSGWAETRFPQGGSVAAGLWTITREGPLLKLSWALDHDTAKPSLTYLTPDGFLHFGMERVIQVFMGKDPMKLPRYIFKLPYDLTIKGKKAFREELVERLDWYKDEAGSLPLLIEPGGTQNLHSTSRAPSHRSTKAMSRYRPHVDWIGSAPVQLPPQ